MCPHHLMPSSGIAVVAFAPRSTVVGIGAVSRVVDAYARRLALQEQIGEDIVHVLDKHVAPRWVACRIVLHHSCMRMTGGRSHDGPVETLAMVGDESDRETAYLAVGFGRLGRRLSAHPFAIPTSSVLAYGK